MDILVANAGNRLDDLNDGRGVLPFGVSLAQADGHRENRLFTGQGGQRGAIRIGFLAQVLRGKASRVREAHIHVGVQSRRVQGELRAQVGGLLA